MLLLRGQSGFSSNLPLPTEPDRERTGQAKKEKRVFINGLYDKPNKDDMYLIWAFSGSVVLLLMNMNI